MGAKRAVGASGLIVGAVATSILALGVSLLNVTVGARAASGTTEGLEYVALGDSYAAGLGLPPFDDALEPACGQSAANYPHQLADELGMRLTDVTCSGATTANVLDAGQGAAPVQLDALSSATDVVTVSIGGNDLGFGTIAASCVALSPAGPVLGPPAGSASCRDLYAPAGGTDALAERLGTVVAPALDATFAAIADAAPNAEVFVVGYPAIAPDAANTPGGPDAGCFTSAIPNGLQPPFPEQSFPFTVTDTVYLHDVQGLLDDAMREAAEAAGFTFVPIFAETAGHSACETDGDAYVNGVAVASGSAVPPSVTLRPGALHPNLAGATFMAQRTAAGIAEAFGPASTPDGDVAPQALWIAIAGAAVVGAGGTAAFVARSRRARS